MAEVPKPIQRHFHTSTFDNRQLPSAGGILRIRITGQEQLQPTARHLGEGKLLPFRESFRSAVEIIGQLDLRPRHDVKFTSCYPFVNLRPTAENLCDVPEGSGYSLMAAG
jgi:hypothetical protein